MNTDQIIKDLQQRIKNLQILFDNKSQENQARRIRRQKVKFAEVLKDISAAHRSSATNLMVLLLESNTNLKNSWKLIMELHEDIIAEEDQPAEGYEELFSSVQQQYEDIIHELRVKIQEIAEAQQQNNDHREHMKFQIQPVEIEKFSGDYMKWQTFFERFTDAVERAKCTKVERLHYLFNCLEGEARQVISSLQLTVDNYENALTLLKDRFENNRRLMKTYIETILDLPSVQRTPESIISLHDKLQDCILNLEKMNCKIDGPLVVTIIMRKLDFETLKSFEEQLSDPKSMPSLDQLLKFLTIRHRLLESIRNNRRSCNSTPRYNDREKNVKPRVVMHFTTTMHAGKQMCPFCKNKHSLYQCHKFIAISVRERREFVKKEGLCFKCMEPKCRWTCRLQCKKCKCNHHKLLHEDNKNESSRTSKVVALVSCFKVNHPEKQVWKTEKICKTKTTNENVLCKKQHFVDNIRRLPAGKDVVNVILAEFKRKTAAHFLEQHLARQKALIPKTVPMVTAAPKQKLYVDYFIDHSGISRLTESAKYTINEKIKRIQKGIIIGAMSNPELLKNNSIIRVEQKHNFPDEVKEITTNKQCHRPSSVTLINLFLEKEIHRGGGRWLANLLLTQEQPITRLIIRDEHIKTFHGSLQLTHNILRTKLWIVNEKSSVATITTTGDVMEGLPNMKLAAPNLYEVKKRIVATATISENIVFKNHTEASDEKIHQSARVGMQGSPSAEITELFAKQDPQRKRPKLRDKGPLGNQYWTEALHQKIGNSWSFEYTTTQRAYGAIICNGIEKDIRLKDTSLIKINDECILKIKDNMLRDEREPSVTVKTPYLKTVETSVNTKHIPETKAYAPFEPTLNIADSFFDVTEVPEILSLSKIHVVTQHAVSATAAIILVIGLYIIWTAWTTRYKRKSVIYQVKKASRFQTDIRSPSTQPRRVWPTVDEHLSTSTAGREHVQQCAEQSFYFTATLCRIGLR